MYIYNNVTPGVGDGQGGLACCIQELVLTIAKVYIPQGLRSAPSWAAGAWPVRTMLGIALLSAIFFLSPCKYLSLQSEIP